MGAFSNRMDEQSSKNTPLTELRRLVAGAGVRSGLIFLNKLTSHRFTALYRFDGELLRNLFFFDRENPGQVSSPEIPILASYCVFVRDSGETFNVSNSEEDERVAGHPKRLQIRAYIGVPLLDEDGKMFGTICHFDVQPRPIEEENVQLMEQMAGILKKSTNRLPN
jgi:GAF domain-containing protein